MHEFLANLNHELAALAGGTLDSLVQIHIGDRGVGAGSIWHGDGLIVTNAHVVAGNRRRVADRVRVSLRDGAQMDAQVIAADSNLDLAALRIPATGLPTVVLGDSRTLHPGQLVMALGFPYGVTGGVTTGVVIGAGADLPELSGDRREWIAASVRLRPGHSGGPLVDSLGRLVGINTLMTGPEVGVALPVHVAMAFLKHCLGRRPEDARQVVKV